MDIQDRLSNETTLIPLKALARIIGIHYQTLYNSCREGMIPHIRVGRRIKFDGAAISRWIAERQMR